MGRHVDPDKRDTASIPSFYEGADSMSVEEVYTPVIPPYVRTVAYFTALTFGVVATLATGISAIWFPEYAKHVQETSALITGVVAAIAGALGVAYRPTK